MQCSVGVNPARKWLLSVDETQQADVTYSRARPAAGGLVVREQKYVEQFPSTSPVADDQRTDDNGRQQVVDEEERQGAVRPSRTVIVHDCRSSTVFDFSRRRVVAVSFHGSCGCRPVADARRRYRILHCWSGSASTQYELIPLQTVQYRTQTTLGSHRLHRRLLYGARLQTKVCENSRPTSES